MLVILTVHDTEIKGYVSHPERPTQDQNLVWGLMVHDINFLYFAKGKK